MSMLNKSNSEGCRVASFSKAVDKNRGMEAESAMKPLPFVVALKPFPFIISCGH